MKLDELDLHDSLMGAVEFNLPRQIAMIKLDCYLTSDAASRTPVRLEFKGVREVTCIGDWDQLKKNSKAGNVNYWVPNEGANPTFIYLNEGCIAVRAKSIRILRDD